MHRLLPHQVEPSPTDGNVLATVEGVTSWFGNSVLLLEAGSDAGDVPAETPIGTIILIKT